MDNNITIECLFYYSNMNIYLYNLNVCIKILYIFIDKYLYSTIEII